MPHQCVRCTALYEDGQVDILKGCNCGAKMFYYIRPEKFKKIQEEATAKRANLDLGERKQIEEDVYDMIGEEIDRDKPVILDLESVEVLGPGKYNLDIVKLFKSTEPFIIKLEDGKYYVDLVENFKRLGEGRKKR